MKTCKKLFSLLLVAVMLVSVIPFASFADGEDTGDGTSAVTPVAEGAGTGEGGGTGEVAQEAKKLTKLDVFVEGGETVKDQPIDITTGYTGSAPSVVWGAAQVESRARALLKAAGLEEKYGTGYVFLTTVWDFANSKGIVTLKPVSTPDTGSGSGSGSTGTGSTGTGSTGSGSTGTGSTGSGSTGTGSTGSGSTGGSGSSGSTTTTGYSEVAVVYLDENGAVRNNRTVILAQDKLYKGNTDDAAAQTILNHAGISEDVSSYASATVNASGNTVTVTLKDKTDTRHVLNLTIVTGTTSTTKTYKTAYAGGVDTMSVLKGFGVDKDFNLNNYTFSALQRSQDGKTFTLTMTAKPTAADMYTVICIANGTQFDSKTNVTYTGSFESTIANAQAILNAAGIKKTASEYKKVTITKSNSGVITVDLRNTIVVRVYNNANSYSEVTMDIGQPYVNYLGANLINNSTFGGITVKDTSDRNTYYSASQVNGRTALVSAFDKEITIQRNGDSCTLYFLRSDGTVLESRKLYAGDQIGTLPSYIVGNVPATWTYNGKPISATDVYNFKTTSVNIVPYFGGISDVYVDVYTNGNVKTLQTRVKVTDMVQNGVLYLNSEVKSAISSALRNTSNKNLTYTAFFDASTWSDFIKTKNTNGAAEPIRVGDNSERQGSVYLYVMVNNVTQKATDSTNPKTGDDVKLGVAVAVLAVAVVGFGAAIVIKKKKGVQ